MYLNHTKSPLWPSNQEIELFDKEQLIAHIRWCHKYIETLEEKFSKILYTP